MTIVLSFGGGSQSSALLALILQDKIERPDYVIFSDTGSEMPHTYNFIEDKVKPECEFAGLEFVTVTNEEKGPLYLAYSERDSLPIVGSKLCTSEWKRRPILRYIKERLGYGPNERAPPNSVTQWLGISTDERSRVSSASPLWIPTAYPLLERHLSRDDCHRINQEFWGMKPLKSSCFMCPYQPVKDWQYLRLNEPDLFQLAKDMEIRAIERTGHGFFNDKTFTLNRLDFNRTLDDYLPPDVQCDGGNGCFL